MKKLIYLTVLFLSSSILAQKYELGEVTKEELLEKVISTTQTKVYLMTMMICHFKFSIRRGNIG